MTAPQQFYTPAEYLAFEAAATTKHEYVNGRIYAMSGASSNHDRIVVNLTIGIGTQLRGRPCRLFSSDMRVKVPETGMYTYPDLSALCGPVEFEETRPPSLLNPGVLIEVLSESTEAYNRGAKFSHYRRLPSLREYVLIAQDYAHIDHFTLGDGGLWTLREVASLDGALELPTIDCTLAMRDVYDGVELRGEGLPPGPTPVD